MNLQHVSIGMLFSAVALHLAIALSIFVFYSNFDSSWEPGEPRCTNSTYAEINKKVCDAPGWAHSTPLKPLAEAWPDEGGLTLPKITALTVPFLSAIIQLLYPTYPILYDVDPIIEIVVTIILTTSIIATILLIFSVGQRILSTLVGGRPTPF